MEQTLDYKHESSFNVNYINLKNIARLALTFNPIIVFTINKKGKKIVLKYSPK